MLGDLQRAEELQQIPTELFQFQLSGYSFPFDAFGCCRIHLSLWIFICLFTSLFLFVLQKSLLTSFCTQGCLWIYLLNQRPYFLSNFISLTYLGGFPPSSPFYANFLIPFFNILLVLLAILRQFPLTVIHPEICLEGIKSINLNLVIA